ncbi:M3 family metallopeptidase [uncultured Odoribacter sp.]|uniref:M3 family metallopeptidase n=1 Tax=uncultured Odoribacter sp. TaxID=876416 RepID=UPI002623DDC6|nr:M3 family metallopeptidase [uncultured Odoribacter sp.]
MTTPILPNLSVPQQEKNPLLENFNTPHSTPPFGRIQTKDYLPAFDQAIARAQQEIRLIAESSGKPDFENTIAALDATGERLNTVSAIFFNLNSANTNPEMQKIAQEISPKLTAFGNSIYMNPRLFERVKQIYEKRSELSLPAEQSTLLDKTWKSFINGGANLKGEAKERFKEITIELSKLGLQFEENLLAETNNFELLLTEERDLSGLPEGVVEAAALAAKEKEKTGWLFTLHAPSYGPFMKYADNRELREKMYRAYNSRSNHPNAHDNREIIRRITALRLEKAQIMGYPTFADYVLTNRMAESPEEVSHFLTQLFTASHPFTLQEKKEVEEFARSLGFNDELQRWDWSYYSNKLKQKKYDLDDEMLKPYFKLENVQKGIFDLANTLYGLQFEEVNNIPKYHPDIKTFEVYDQDRSFLAVLYVDFFPRASKSGGAWMTEFQNQHIQNGQDIRPQVSLVMNFTRPTESKPSLLTFDEVTTFLHEFGHSLHGMLSRNTYNATAGTSVYRDFVELPSQIMENWALEKEWLDKWAVHYETGEKIPTEYIEKIRQAANFQSGYLTDRQLSFGMVDMAWHSITQAVTGSITDFERKAMQATEIFPPVEGTCFSTTFAHIFGGGYAAGYYSYKWAEVLDADAFSVFQENGIFDPVTAKSFRENILEKGGSEHPVTLYIRFRGHKPTVDALLKRNGLQ